MNYLIKHAFEGIHPILFHKNIIWFILRFQNG